MRREHLLVSVGGFLFVSAVEKSSLCCSLLGVFKDVVGESLIVLAVKR